MINSIFCKGLERSREAQPLRPKQGFLCKQSHTEQPNEDGGISQDSEADDQGLFLPSKEDGEEEYESHSRHSLFKTAYHRSAPAKAPAKMRPEAVERLNCAHW